MKTRYWKNATTGGVTYKLEDGTLSVIGTSGWFGSILKVEAVEESPCLVECDERGNPLAGRLTLEEFDAFAARIRANLALLEKEGER